MAAPITTASREVDFWRPQLLQRVEQSFVFSFFSRLKSLLAAPTNTAILLKCSYLHRYHVQGEGACMLHLPTANGQCECRILWINLTQEELQLWDLSARPLSHVWVSIATCFFCPLVFLFHILVVVFVSAPASTSIRSLPLSLTSTSRYLLYLSSFSVHLSSSVCAKKQRPVQS